MIAADDTEVECDDLAGRPLRFHQACCEAWETERDFEAWETERDARGD